MEEKIVYQKDLDLKSDFLTEQSREEYIRCVMLQIKKELFRFIVEEEIDSGYYDALVAYSYALVKISAAFYCPLYIKYNPSIKIFRFGLLLTYLHIDTFAIPEWKLFIESQSIEIEAISDDFFQLEVSVEAGKHWCNEGF